MIHKNPFCNCGSGLFESNSHYYLHCSKFPEQKLNLLNNINHTNSSILQNANTQISGH